MQMSYETNGHLDATLIDYFVVCGLDLSTGIETDRSVDIVKNNQLSPLERSYLAKVLAHYPECRDPTKPFTKEVLPLCLPRGLRLCTQKDRPEAEFHSFVNVAADGSRNNGCALVFYEEVTNPEVCQAVHTLHTLHFAELSSQGPLQNRSANNSAPVSGPNPSGCHTLPRRGKTGGKKRSKASTFYDFNKDKLYSSKCIAVLCELPAVCACELLLKSLYKLCWKVNTSSLPMEAYVYWLLYEIPLPPPSRSLKFSLEGEDIVCQRPGCNELPFFEYNFLDAFELLGVENFLKAYTCALLEHQILLCSKVFQRLMLVAECLTALLFPFHWQHVYVPIVPYSQTLFLEAPLPFIMGLHYEDSIPEEVSQANICLVDVDTGRLELPEDLPALPNRDDLLEEIAQIMERFTNAAQNLIALERKKQEHHLKRMSRSFDEDAALLHMENNNYHPVPPNLNRDPGKPPPHPLKLPPLQLSVLQESESFARAQNIAKKVGVNIRLDDIVQHEAAKTAFKQSPTCKRYFEVMKFNNAVREIFLNRFTYMFFSYDHFVIGGDTFADRDSFVNGREFQTLFDKASYLSDQPASHLPFIAAFIETQMFACFIDAKILSHWETPEMSLKLFDQRIAEIRQRYGDAMVRTPIYETAPSFSNTEDLIAKREESLDYEVPAPHAIEGMPPPLEGSDQSGQIPGVFPVLSMAALNKPPSDPCQRSPWKQRNRTQRHREHLERASSDDQEKHGQPAKWLKKLAALSAAGSLKNNRSSYHPGMDLTDVSQAQYAEMNWKFVEQLLRETKGRTKRMLVDKLGKEAVALGHADLSITGVEENTLVASLCDLLERIWSHGINKKQGKSALWAHLLAQQELDKCPDTAKVVNTSYLSPDDLRTHARHHPFLQYINTLQHELDIPGAANKTLIKAASFLSEKLDFAPTWSPVAGGSEPSSPTKQRSGSAGSRPVDPLACLRPLPSHITYDLRNVLKMTEIKTDIGFARAFVRLSLERKLLHKHLKTVLSNQDLLRALYKRTAFLRCEEEREQFLYHILSLNAVDYRCFTNTFQRTS